LFSIAMALSLGIIGPPWALLRTVLE
jgi:hypothetical protein